MRKFIVGNWKMNGLSSDIAEIAAIAELSKAYPNVDCGLCLPATLLSRDIRQTPNFSIGGQDCHRATSGAHTGCISADMLKDAGANMTIVGHSERRASNNESDRDVQAKAIAAIEAELHAIICVGETQAQRNAGEAISVVQSQLDGSVPSHANSNVISIAYEPVWAIGTGLIPSPEDVKAMHTAIRDNLNARFGIDGVRIHILYGGSMNGDNAAMLLGIENVDGGLIGGASLTAAKFGPIIAAANAVL
jgi:triosephosphate isomerase (TIM)